MAWASILETQDVMRIELVGRTEFGNALSFRPLYYGHQFWAEAQATNLLTHVNSTTWANGRLNKHPFVLFNINTCLTCTTVAAYYDTFFALAGVQSAHLAQFLAYQSNELQASLANISETLAEKRLKHAWLLGYGYSRSCGMAQWMATCGYPKCLHPLDYVISSRNTQAQRIEFPIKHILFSPVYVNIAEPLVDLSAYWRSLVKHPLACVYSNMPVVLDSTVHLRWPLDILNPGSAEVLTQEQRAEAVEQLRAQRVLKHQAPAAYRLAHEFQGGPIPAAPIQAEPIQAAPNAFRIAFFRFGITIAIRAICLAFGLPRSD